MLNNSTDRYGVLSRSVHWLSAAIIIALIVVGWYMTGLAEEDPARRNIYNLHKSVGVLSVLLLVIRFAWLKVSPAPELPAAFATKERQLTLSMRALLYVLMLLVPMSGYVMSTAAGYPVPFFGLFTMPALIGESEGLAGFAHEAHAILAYSILAVVALHILGALKHRLTDRGGPSDILARML